MKLIYLFTGLFIGCLLSAPLGFYVGQVKIYEASAANGPLASAAPLSETLAQSVINSATRRGR